MTGNDSTQANPEDDPDLVKGTQKSQSVLIKEETSHSDMSAAALTDLQPPLPVLEPSITEKSEIVARCASHLEPKSVVHLTEAIVPQKHVIFYAGEGIRDQPIMMKEENVESWFGKKLKIVLVRVDEKIRNSSKKEKRLQSDTRSKKTAQNCVDIQDSVDSIIKIENHFMWEEDSGIKSEVQNELTNYSTDLETTEDDDLKSSNTLLSSVNVKLEKEWEEQSSDFEFVSCNPERFSRLQSVQSDSTIHSKRKNKPTSGFDNTDVSINGRIKLQCPLMSEYDIDERPELDEEFACKITKRIKAEIFDSEYHNSTFFVASGNVDCKIEGRSPSFGTHRVSKPFACTLCNAKFYEMDNLNAHILTHTVSKAFVCTFCNAKFSQEVNLNRHLETHTQLKTYACAQCNRKYSHADNLDAHVKKYRHKHFKTHSCALCSATFFLKMDLAKHEKTHEPLKPFACALCGATFSKKNQLNKHIIESHTCKQRHTCTRCNEQFFSQLDLEEHVMEHCKC